MEQLEANFEVHYTVVYSSVKSTGLKDFDLNLGPDCK